MNKKQQTKLNKKIKRKVAKFKKQFDKNKSSREEQARKKIKQASVKRNRRKTLYPVGFEYKDRQK